MPAHSELMVQILTVFLHSDYSGSRFRLAKILLNGNNICMVRRPMIVKECFLLANHNSLFPEERDRPYQASGFGQRNICSMERRVIQAFKSWRNEPPWSLEGGGH